MVELSQVIKQKIDELKAWVKDDPLKQFVLITGLIAGLIALGYLAIKSRGQILSYTMIIILFLLCTQAIAIPEQITETSPKYFGLLSEKSTIVIPASTELV